jgi:TonB family protein
MTPTKDTLESGNSPADLETSRTRSRQRPESPHLRADAVSLEIPVKVHGSIVPNLSAGASPQAQPFEEQTSTMIVFPQGGVLKMSTNVGTGQVMVLTNLKSRQDAICRVIKVRAYGKTQSYVEVEFTSPQPGYWGVYFPTDDPEAARAAQPEPAGVPVAPPANATFAPGSSAPVAETRQQEAFAAPDAASSSAEKTPEPVVQAEQPKPVMPATLISKPKLPESMFASIGTREDVLPSAAATRLPRASSFESGVKVVASADTDISDAIDALIVPTAPGARTSPKTDESGREASAGARSVASPAGRSAGAVSSLNPAPEQALPTPKQMFGVTLDSASRIPGKSSQREGSKAPLFIGVAAVLALAAGGAYYYLHMRPSARAAAAAVVATAPAVQPTATQNSAVPNPVAQMPASNAPAVPQPAPELNASQSLAAEPANGAVSESGLKSNLRATEPREKTHEAETLAPRHERASSVAVGESKAQAQAEPNVAIPSTFGALNTRPVVKAQSSSVGAAPSLEPGGSPAPEGTLSGIAAPPPPPKLAVPPKPVSNDPVRVGGDVLPPKVISSVLPTYPALAQQAGVTGTVVVDTTIDKEGRVEKMKIVSGPVLLRDAALNALRQWRYAPSKLNGQPISVEMIVSIRFNR